MSIFKVTSKGMEALSADIVLLKGTINLTEGTEGKCWTRDATFKNRLPVDTEGWCPWHKRGTVEDVLSAGYIEEVL